MMYHTVMLETLVCTEHSYSTTLDLVGRQIWRGALLLADFVLHHGPSLLQGHTVLELASGVGLTSIVAAMFATEVICTGDKFYCVLHLGIICMYIYIYIYSFIYLFSVNTFCSPGILKCMLFQLNSQHLMLSYLFMLMSVTDHVFNVLNLAGPAIAWQMVKLYF